MTPTQQARETHTPGPWRCDVVIDGRADFASSLIQPQYVINRRGVGSPIIPRLEAAANARLMAAAPELLDALKRALQQTGCGDDCPHEWHGEAQALVARIEGIA